MSIFLELRKIKIVVKFIINKLWLELLKYLINFKINFYNVVGCNFLMKRIEIFDFSYNIVWNILKNILLEIKLIDKFLFIIEKKVEKLYIFIGLGIFFEYFLKDIDKYKIKFIL